MYEIFGQLEPVLEHNRRESRALLRRMLWAGGVAVIAIVPLAIMTPPERAGVVVGLWMGTLLVVLSYLEARRIALFRKDLRERRGD